MSPLEQYIATILGDEGIYDEELAELVEQYVRRAMQSGAAGASHRYDVELTFDIQRPETQAWLRNYVGLMAHEINETIREGVRMAVMQGIAAGEGWRPMADRVLELAFGCERNEAGKIVATEKLDYRAEVIARTENARAQIAGESMQMKDAGFGRKVWMANPTACEFCLELDGKTVEIDEPYFRRGDVMEIAGTDRDGNETVHRMKLDYSDTPHPPLHPNCACVLDYAE